MFKTGTKPNIYKMKFDHKLSGLEQDISKVEDLVRNNWKIEGLLIL